MHVNIKEVRLIRYLTFIWFSSCKNIELIALRVPPSTIGTAQTLKTSGTAPLLGFPRQDFYRVSSCVGGQLTIPRPNPLFLIIRATYFTKFHIVSQSVWLLSNTAVSHTYKKQNRPVLVHQSNTKHQSLTGCYTMLSGYCSLAGTA
jgi:hypothetical protein